MPEFSVQKVQKHERGGGGEKQNKTKKQTKQKPKTTTKKRKTKTKKTQKTNKRKKEKKKTQTPKTKKQNKTNTQCSHNATNPPQTFLVCLPWYHQPGTVHWTVRSCWGYSAGGALHSVQGSPGVPDPWSWPW